MSRDLIGSSGATIALWVLEETIGSPGEQGEVWLAHSRENTAIKFAIKIGAFPIRGVNDAAYREFVREFDALASLSHPSIVKVYHRGIFDHNDYKYPFYVMEYLGRNTLTLKSALKRSAVGTKLSLGLKALLDTASALEHVHEKKRVHGDVKASNILVYDSGTGVSEIKLIDFGFSRMVKRVGQESGRLPTSESSRRRTVLPISPMHYDIWQLAYTIRRAFDEEIKDVEPRKDNLNNWPIDHSDFDRVSELLDDWSSGKAGSAPERKNEIQAFRREIRSLREKSEVRELSPDVKGAIRYFAIPELATAAHIQPAFEAIRIPPRQLVLYTERIKELITAPELGALRYTRQLGLTHLVYPGAQGTRFEHSLGVYGLACRFVTRMIGHPAFRKACGDKKDILKFLLASLLHDVGHFPLAHQLEEFSVHDFTRTEWKKVRNLVGDDHDSHRRYALALLNGDSVLLKRLQEPFGFDRSDVEDIRCLAHRKHHELVSKRAAIRFLHCLLDGPIDLDKIDYVERDAHHCGVPYGHYLDVDRLLETMRVVEEPGATGPSLAFDWRAVGSLEQMATARHQMYANVFWHRAVRSATTMFKHAFFLYQRLVSRDQLEALFFHSGSDDGLLGAMRDDRAVRRGKGEDELAIVDLLESVSGRSRLLYKELIDREHTEKRLERYGQNLKKQRATAGQIFRTLKRKGLLAAEADRLRANNILIDCHADSSPNFDAIRIRNSRGRYENLGARFAPSVTLLKDNFRNQACRIRVFINIRALKDEFHNHRARAEIGKLIMDSVQDIDATERGEHRP